MTVLEPVIVEREPFKVIGLEYSGPMENFEGISALWGSYIKRAKEIDPKVGKRLGFGVFYSTPEQAEMGETCYMACAQVTDKTTTPEGMEKMHVPGGTFAMLTHKGIMTDLPRAFQTLFSWIADLPYETLSAPGYEMYDERFSASSPECEIDIFIPVRVQ